MRYRTQIKTPRRARARTDDRAALTGGGSPIDAAAIGGAAEDIAGVAAVLGEEDEAPDGAQVTVEIDPEAPLVADANLRVLGRTPKVCEAATVTQEGLERLLDQRSEMALLHGTARDLDRDLADGEAVVQAVEAREVQRLVRGIRALMASEAGDFAELLGSDAAEVLKLDDELQQARRDERKRTTAAGKAAKTQLGEQERRNRLLGALLERRRGGRPDPETLAEAAATFGEAPGPAAPAPAPAGRRRRPR